MKGAGRARATPRAPRAHLGEQVGDGAEGLVGEARAVAHAQLPQARAGGGRVALEGVAGRGEPGQARVRQRRARPDLHAAADVCGCWGGGGGRADSEGPARPAVARDRAGPCNVRGERRCPVGEGGAATSLLHTQACAAERGGVRCREREREGGREGGRERAREGARETD